MLTRTFAASSGPTEAAIVPRTSASSFVSAPVRAPSEQQPAGLHGERSDQRNKKQGEEASMIGRNAVRFDRFDDDRPKLVVAKASAVALELAQIQFSTVDVDVHLRQVEPLLDTWIA